MRDKHGRIENAHDDPFARFIGTSKAINLVHEKIEHIAASNTPVFITGQSGTGKEICARAVHHKSNRWNNPFVPFNCAALPHHLFESALFGHIKGAFTGADNNRDGAILTAQKGSLFLDEICDMPLEAQTKLLRFFDDFSYQKLGSDKFLQADIRIICATNKDPLTQIDKGLFREDLYYRLHVFPIEVPVLQDRGGDIIDIAHFYLKQYSFKYQKNFKGFSDSAIHLLKNYNWPGNIRELKNTLQQIIASENGQLITAPMLPDFIRKTNVHHNFKQQEPFQHISMPLWRIEQDAIEQTISLCNGNISRAAAILEISPSTIYRKMQNWHKKN